MRPWSLIVVAIAAIAMAISGTRSPAQAPTVRAVDPKTLKEYAGVYQWSQNAFVYVQLWNELTGTDQLVAFDESGEVRILFPTDGDRFFTGPGLGVASAIESRVEFQRDDAGKIAALTWQRKDTAPRVARRVDVEKREDVTFTNGDVRLAGTLIAPNKEGKHPALILVHGSGPQNRDWCLPFARFLIRHGMAVLGYDKRGVGGSTGDWNKATFDDLAGDVVAAFEYLKTRPDVDGKQIGLIGVSQAGWIMPIASVRAKDIAFLISVSGPGVPAAETTIDHAQHVMTAAGMPAEVVTQIITLMKLQYEYARTGEGWEKYLAARQPLAARRGFRADLFPEAPDHPYWQFMRGLYFHDPAPVLRQLQTPTLALFGELDNNILPEKNKAAWEAALKAGGNRDYELRVLPKAYHLQLEAKVGNNEAMTTLDRFVPEYFTVIHDWLAKRVRGYAAAS